MRRFKQTPDFQSSNHGANEPAAKQDQKVRWYYTTVSKDLAVRVKNHAHRLTCSRSTIINLALKEFLDRHGG